MWYFSGYQHTNQPTKNGVNILMTKLVHMTSQPVYSALGMHGWRLVGSVVGSGEMPSWRCSMVLNDLLLG